MHEAFPGETLKRITEEYRYMEQFVSWLKRRLEMDKNYLDALKALSMSANSQWSQSSLSPLLSPVLHLLAQEVEGREAMCNTVNTYLQGLSNVCSPDWNEDTSEHMVSKYENLIAACKRHESCREIASSPDAVKELQQWHHQGPNDTSLMTLDDILDADFEHFVMPPAEREYRESVSQQTTLAYAVNGWHRTQLSERLDSHQSRIEEVKLLAGRVVSEHSRLSTALVGHLEATKSNIHEFSSSSSISWAHDQCDLESDHLYLKKPVHIDFSNGKRQSHVIFGTISKASLEARCALKALGEKHELSRLYLTNPVKDGALKLERLPTRELESLSVPKLRLLLSFALLSSPPLVPLLEEDIKRYATSE